MISELQEPQWEEKLKWSDSNSEYQKELISIINRKSSAVFPSIGPEQSALIMSNMFLTTKNEILIYSNSFSGVVSSYKNYIDSLDQYLKQKGMISLLIDSDPKLDSVAYNKIKEYLENSHNGGIRKTTDEGLGILKSSFRNSVNCHFAVGDSNKYLLEMDAITKQSVSSFNHPAVAKNLRNIFEYVFTISDNII